MSFALAVLKGKGAPTPVVVSEGVCHLLADFLPEEPIDSSRGLLDLMPAWDAMVDKVQAALQAGPAGRRATQPLSSPFDYAAPLQRPGKVICTGTNYYDHLRDDLGIHDFDKTRAEILYFMKHPGAVVGPGPARYPSHSTQLDWEVELVVVIGRPGRRIPPETALTHVAGYAIGLDLSVRDWQFNPRHAKGFDLIKGKSFDDSSPLGPAIVPARFVDPADLSLELRVNGVTKQRSHTREMRSAAGSPICRP